MAEVLDVKGGGFSRNGLSLGPLVLLQLRLLVDLLGCGFDDGPVFVQLVLQPLDEFVFLVELQFQFVDQRVPLTQLLDFLLERVLEVAQGAHRQRLNSDFPVSLTRGARCNPLSSAAPLTNFIRHGRLQRAACPPPPCSLP